MIRLDTVTSEQVVIGGLTVSRDTQFPGWRWSTHVRPLVGTEWCEVRHVGLMLSGRQAVLLRDGTEFTMEPGDVMDLPSWHDAWVVGDEPVVTIGWTGAKTWLGPLETLSDRVLATIVITDIVDSTNIALGIGDRAWSDRMAALESRTRDLIGQYHGRLVKFTGDGTLATFDGAHHPVHDELSALHTELLRAMLTLEVPIVAAVQGAAVGFGAELAALCDLVVMGDDASLSDPQATGENFAYHSYPRGQRIGRAIRTERYRLVEWKVPGEPADTAEIELYDYEMDPGESKNHAEEQPDVVSELRARLAQQPEATRWKQMQN